MNKEQEIPMRKLQDFVVEFYKLRGKVPRVTHIAQYFETHKLIALVLVHNAYQLKQIDYNTFVEMCL